MPALALVTIGYVGLGWDLGWCVYVVWFWVSWTVVSGSSELLGEIWGDEWVLETLLSIELIWLMLLSKTWSLWRVSSLFVFLGVFKLAAISLRF